MMFGVNRMIGCLCRKYTLPDLTSGTKANPVPKFIFYQLAVLFNGVAEKFWEIHIISCHPQSGQLSPSPCGVKSRVKKMLDRYFGKVNHSPNGELSAVIWHAEC
jgi:hypothetical protein